MAEDELADVIYNDDPPVCIIGDSLGALGRMRQSAARAGCRVTLSAEIGRISEFQFTPSAAALIELDGMAGEEAVARLDWAQGEAAGGIRNAVVSTPAALIDLVAARTPSGHVIQLCGASEAERIAAILAASAPAPARFHDVRRGESQPILQQLTEDVSRIAAILSALSEDEAMALAGARPQAPGGPEETAVGAPEVRAILRARRMRDQFFGGELFADPAWDMLLDLMAARIEGKRVAVSSLCIAASVPATTALRWIKMLTDRGVFVRAADPKDGRRVYIELSEDASRALTAYLRAAERLGVSVI